MTREEQRAKLVWLIEEEIERIFAVLVKQESDWSAPPAKSHALAGPIADVVLDHLGERREQESSRQAFVCQRHGCQYDAQAAGHAAVLEDLREGLAERGGLIADLFECRAQAAAHAEDVRKIQIRMVEVADHLRTARYLLKEHWSGKEAWWVGNEHTWSAQADDEIRKAQALLAETDGR